MDTSIFLAKLMGPVLLVMGLFVVLRPASINRIGREFLDSEALLFMSGILTLPAGLAIVITHNVWAADWRVLITVFGWIAILAGIARIVLPDMMRTVGKSMTENTLLIAVPGVLMALLGAYLAYQGYLA
ncbi:MAG: hypothetical protein ACTSU0_04170 [Alphaproteobacteria bacterium]